MHDQRIYTKFNEILQMRNDFKKPGFNWVNKEKFEGVFRYCLNSLKEEYRMILVNSYFEQDYQFWWLDYFCKSSYYRKRFWAIVAFVRLFEMIYENSDACSAYLNSFC